MPGTLGWRCSWDSFLLPQQSASNCRDLGSGEITRKGGARGRETREADQEHQGHSWRAKATGAGREEGHGGPEQRPRQDRLHRGSGEEGRPGEASPRRTHSRQSPPPPSDARASPPRPGQTGLRAARAHSGRTKRVTSQVTVSFFGGRLQREIAPPSVILAISLPF